MTAPPSPVALLDQLDELRAKATPGPWEVEDDWIWAGINGGGAFGELVTKAVDIEDADVALIVAAVNALPELSADLRKHHAAVRAVLAQHERVGGDCVDCGGVRWPCPTVAAVTAALSVTP